MTPQEVEIKVNEIIEKLKNNFLFVDVVRYIDPVCNFAHWVIFVYTDESHTQQCGKVETKINPQTGVVELFWRIKWYTMLSPAKGSFRPLYEADSGYSDTLDTFFKIAEKYVLSGETKLKRDRRKKQIIEEAN